MSEALVLQHLERLVAFDTTSDRSNLPLIEYVEQELAPLADELRIVANPAGDKAGLLARFGPAAPGGIVLTGHTDCVPVADQPWTGDPFRLRQVGSRLIGRGVTDMKGFIACCMVAAQRMAQQDLHEPIWLVLTYDEELGAAAAGQLVDALVAAGGAPRAVIVGEPTSMGIVNGHKGIYIGRIRITGHAVHSSMPEQGVDALRAAIAMVRHIEDQALEQRAHVDERFDPPYTTMNVGRLSAGTAVNIVPSSAELLFEYRGVPGSDGPQLGQRLAAYAREVLPTRFGSPLQPLGVSVEELAAAPALRPEEDGEAERVARLALGDPSPVATVAYATDGSAFQARGFSTVVCGPGSIEQAHQPDESIERSQLGACSSMLDSIIERCGRGADPVRTGSEVRK